MPRSLDWCRVTFNVSLLHFQLAPTPEPLDLLVKMPQQLDANGQAHDDTSYQQISSEIELSRKTYPEWDAQLLLMREDWRTVVEKRSAWQRKPTGMKSDTSELPLVTWNNSRRLSRSKRLRLQWEGDDIDLNAAIEAMLDQRLKLAPGLRLFMRPGHEELESSRLPAQLSTSYNRLAAS